MPDTTLHASSPIILYPPRRYRIIYALLAPCMVVIGLSYLVTLLVIVPLWLREDILTGWFPLVVLGGTISLSLLATSVLILGGLHVFGHTKTRLLLSETEVILDTYWATITTSWANIERIGIAPMGVVHVEAFLLTQPASIRYRWKKFPFTPDYRHAIPVVGFGRTWGDDPLARTIRQYAPQLLPIASLRHDPV